MLNIAAAALAACLPFVALAQEFEVVSVKPSNPADSGMRFEALAGTWHGIARAL